MCRHFQRAAFGIVDDRARPAHFHLARLEHRCTGEIRDVRGHTNLNHLLRDLIVKKLQRAWLAVAHGHASRAKQIILAEILCRIDCVELTIRKISADVDLNRRIVAGPADQFFHRLHGGVGSNDLRGHAFVAAAKTDNVIRIGAIDRDRYRHVGGLNLFALSVNPDQDRQRRDPPESLDSAENVVGGERAREPAA